MTPRAFTSVLLLVAAAAGCSSAAGTSMAGGVGGNSGARDASTSGAGGNISVKMDAGAGVALRDGGAVSPSLSADGPTFNYWDARACQTCALDGGSPADSAAAGGSGGAGGKTGVGGSTGAASGGAVGSGGATSRGGATGSGGISMDAPTTTDVRTPDALPTNRDGGPPPPDTASDVVTADSYPPPSDASSRCVTRIRSLVPSTDALDQFLLVAGSNTQVVLRAEIDSGGPASPSWTWQASRDGALVTPTRGQQDLAAAAFPVTVDGNYTFTARENASLCSATVRVYAWPANACPDCDHSVILRAAPPPGGSVPVQSGAMALSGAPPFSQNNVVLATGVSVLVSPSVGSNLVPSYVRISSPAGDLVADGLADPRAGFAALLLAIDPNRALLSYDLLVVPIDGPDGSTVAATAPQLFQSYSPDQIKKASFALSGGLTVTGTTLSATGQPVPDARVILTNRNPTSSAQPQDLVFSSVGRADTQGSFSLHAQPDSYWVSVSPPAGSGLAEALAPAPLTLAGNTTVTFRWNAIATATLALNVLDASGANKLDGAQVRLTSAQATTVGSLTFGTSPPQDALGNVRVQATTANGSVTFTNLPSGVAYDALIVPAALGSYAATTLLTVNVPPGGGTVTVQAAPQKTILGKLLSATGGATDWSKVNVFAYDRSLDSPEAPQGVTVNLDGSFSMGVSPERPYVLLAVPDTSTKLARTFVGPGPLESSEFVITQKVQGERDWIATVMDQNGNGLPETALQIFCGPTWPSCVDSTIPLAETTSDTAGSFQLALPDPATR